MIRDSVGMFATSFVIYSIVTVPLIVGPIFKSGLPPSSFLIPKFAF